MNKIKDETNLKEVINDTQEAAIKAAGNILGYAENTINQLREKLHTRGYSEQNVNAAINYVIEHGYIKEDDHLFRFIELSAAKLYGRRRIYMEAKARGFDSTLIKEKFDEYTKNINFELNCAKIISKLISTNASLSSEMSKLISSVMRYGYTIEEIREGYRIYSTKKKKLK